MASTFSNIGTGVGYLYETDIAGTIITSTMYNTPEGYAALQKSALSAAPFSSNTSAFGKVQITVAGGTITSITVNGVTITSGVAIAGATPQIQATNAAVDINSTVSVPDYTAEAIDDTIYIYANPDEGDTPNGFVVVTTEVAPTVAVDTDMTGGSDTAGTYNTNPAFGSRFWLNSDSTALPYSLTGTVEITDKVVIRGANAASVLRRGIQIATGSIAPSRDAALQTIVVSTEALAAADDLDTISTAGYSNGDQLILVGRVVGQVVTVKNATGNIFLANAQDFVSGDPTNTVWLAYLTPTAGTPGWYELNRTPSPGFSVANLRAAGIAMPAQGVDTTTLLAAGGTINLTPGTSKEYQLIDGSPILAASYAFTFIGTPMDGDRFFFDYRATSTVGANTITIAGIQLTSAEALAGQSFIEAYYDTSSASWKAQILTRETSPILLNAISDVATTAVITEETLRSSVLAAGALATDGSVFYSRDVFTTAANANGKTLRKKFGATTICQVSGNMNAETVIVETWVSRISSVSQQAVAKVTLPAASAGVINTMYTSPAEKLLANVTVLTTGQNSVASAADIVNKSTAHEYEVK
jgi:hypothetical protein